MTQARDQQAYQRGIRAARKWLRLKNVIMKWDRLCVSKVREYRLPAWIGHVPIVIALIGSVTAMLFGGLLVAGSMLFIWAIAFILQNVDPSDENTFDDERASGPSIRHGNDGYGYYSSSDDLTSERLD
ncbi:hypothetical protein IM817_01660 [Serratia marcescens]|uniref:hypothetical protein n=1 Tax=Serratia TaxID=613 RepID=UPI0016513BDA|nr:hypothetical protein [Serratia marcescens]MBL5823330.1 hypothetical protein [Serratia marcescens]QXX96964.1 hypothetical protein IM817_01660 [Serratia marcescens]HBC5198998.1 hypothetical protein [Serratia marcescens]HBK4794365.1 hypothetical protein [Serratia marcescens]HEB0103613.1 hypothetical protein [Serratia marcescens]